MPSARLSGLTATLTTLPRLDPDVALVRQFQATGNPALFEALFRKYQTPIFHLVTRMVNGEEAYDLTQEVFLRALRALPSFKGDCKFSTWLYTIAKNTCLNHLRETKKRCEIEDYSLDEPTRSRARSAAGRSRRTRRRTWRGSSSRGNCSGWWTGCWPQLTPEQRLLMTLRDFERLSYEEIGEITDISLVNVKSKLHRARLAFKAKFQPYMALIRSVNLEDTGEDANQNEVGSVMYRDTAMRRGPCFRTIWRTTLDAGHAGRAAGVPGADAGRRRRADRASSGRCRCCTACRRASRRWTCGASSRPKLAAYQAERRLSVWQRVRAELAADAVRVQRGHDPLDPRPRRPHPRPPGALSVARPAGPQPARPGGDLSP